MSIPPPKQSLSSPTSGNSSPPVLPTPSSSTSVRQSVNKPNLLKRELQQQLIEKQKQLQESNSGIGKNVLARQITQLQDKINEIDTTVDLQPSTSTSIDRLRSLEASSYRSHPLSPGLSSIRNKEKLLNQRSPVTSNMGEPLPSPSTSTLLPPPHGHDSSSLLPLPPPPTGSTPTKRRSKIPNTDRRNTDIEFATEIGQGLLLEVRKMQALLQEKEEKLRILENQKADLERAAEAMAKQMRQREENEEKLKEETWNLELAKQELVISVTELQTNLNKANAEQNRLSKQVNDLRSEIEQLRDKEEKLTAAMENMKQRHEQDMSSIRRQAASFQREKQEQTKKIEALTSELAIAKAQSRIAKHVSSETEPSVRSPSEQSESDTVSSTLAVKNDRSPSVSPPSSPKQSPSRNQAMEVETLKTSLAHAHRMVSNLRSNLHKEKMEKFEFKKLLEESRETIEQFQNDPRLWVDASPSRTSSTSNTYNKEENQSRRSHKASVTSSKRRGKAQRRSKPNKFRNTSEDGPSSYSSMSESDQESFDESDEERVGFTSLSSELSQSQKKVYVDAQVNTDESAKEDTEIFTQTKPEPTTTEMATQTDDVPFTDMSVQTKSLPEATEIAVQTEQALVETFVQTEASISAEISVQTEMDTSEIWTQTDDSETFETETQTDDPPTMAEISIQTDKLEASSTSIQTDDTSASEIAIQTDDLAVSEISVQTDSLVNEISTQTETRVLEQSSLSPLFNVPDVGITLEDCVQPSLDIKPEDSSLAVAAMAAATAAAVEAARRTAIESAIDQETQYDISSQDHETQYEAVPGIECAVQSEIVPVDASIQMDPIETGDMSVQYEMETNDVSVQSEAVEKKDSSIQFEPIESKDMSIQSEPVQVNDDKLADSIVQYKPVETKDASVQYEENDTGLVALKNVAASNTTRPLDKKAISVASLASAAIASVFKDKKSPATADNKASDQQPSVISKNEQTQQINTDQDKSTQVDVNVPVQQKTVNDSKIELSDAESLENLPSHQRNVAQNESEKLYSQSETDALIASAVASALASAAKERGQHVSLERTNKDRTDTDSAVVSQYSSALDEEEHIPYVNKQLTATVIGEQVPNNDSYTSEAMDIPIRPSNPHPIDLLSKIHANSSHIDNLSMSPISNRSHNKGKMPYDPYYDLENHSVPSTEDFRQKRSELEKKPSIGASSFSTNYTNEQLQSINSSQFGRSRSAVTSTDPSVINLITQTMIGDWLWKFTRRMVGGGISENRHKRFFWIHPYTRTLYWSTNAPGVNGSEAKTKSALIENVKTVSESNGYGLPNVSLLIQTSQRQLKLIAPNMDKHEAWFEAISYLIARNDNGSSSGFGMVSDVSKKVDNHSNTIKSFTSTQSGTVLKRPSFKRINDIFHPPSVSTTTNSMGTSVGDDHIELGEGDDPLEDVRMCCNGKHHVSKLEKDHINRHHYRKRKSHPQSIK